MKYCIKLYSLLFVLSTVLISCDENPVGPTYKKVGTGTSTNAFITVSPVSATAPTQGSAVTVTLRYVNIKSDPAKSLVLKVREGTGGC